MPTDNKRTIAFSASGGGFRASLFHLGVLKRLEELQILDKVNYMSGVSGGAVTTALLVYLKHLYGADFDFAEFERTLLRGVKTNPRTRWLLRTLLLRFSLRLLPLAWWSVFAEWLKNTFTFDNFFRDEFFGSATLDQLTPNTSPERKPALPRLILNTTALELGQDYYLTPDYIGPQSLAAIGLDRQTTRLEPSGLTVARAVGASACVPAIFPPYVLRVRPESGEKDDDTRRTGVALETARLVDGGVFDNQGFRLFLEEPRDSHIHPEERIKRVDYLIVSDASQTMSPSKNPLSSNPLKRFLVRVQLLLRSHSITEDRARWERFAILLYAQFAHDVTQTAFFHTDSPYQEEPPYCLPEKMKHNLARLRTDFDSFSDLEIMGLMYLGYALVNHRIFSYCRDILPEKAREALSTLTVVPTPWKKVLEHLQGNKVKPEDVDLVPLKRWDTFVGEVSRCLPRRSWFVRNYLGWLEKPWRPFLTEPNPEQPANQRAQQIAISHLAFGSTSSLIWRGLQRLGDRGIGWRVVSILAKATLVAAMVLAGMWLLQCPVMWLDRLLTLTMHWTKALLLRLLG